MRGVCVPVLLLVSMIFVGVPIGQSVPDGAQTLWSGVGTGASHWEQGYVLADRSVDVVQAGFDLEVCFDDAGHGSFIFQQFEVSTPRMGIRVTGLGHSERAEEGLLVETEVTGTLADDSYGYEPRMDGCFGGESWVRFGEPVPLEHFTYRLGFRGAANWSATSWIVLGDGQSVTGTVHESGEGTFILTHEDLVGDNEIRTPPPTASVRVDASASVELATGPQAMLWAFFDRLAHYTLTAPDGTTCAMLDTDATGYSRGDCGRFQSGSGAGTYTVRLDARAGTGRGDFLWAGVDAPSMPSRF